ncbi:MAG: hypothetical protein KC503_37615 [Myxococcales bacterium]|nr:hypothetical protein [Myxococcales bacterium]
MNGYCSVCKALVPLAKQKVGKLIGLAIGAVAGKSFANSAVGVVATAAAALVAGHLIDEWLSPVCGKCGHPVKQQSPQNLHASVFAG